MTENASAIFAGAPASSGRRDVVCYVAACRAVFGVLASLGLLAPLSGAVSRLPGGEHELLSRGGMTALDLALGRPEAAGLPAAIQFVVAALLLATLEVFVSCALFVTVPAGEPGGAASGGWQLIPRFALLAGIKSALAVVLVSAAWVAVPAPPLSSITSVAGWLGWLLRGGAILGILFVLRLTTDLARATSVQEVLSLGSLAQRVYGSLRASWLALSGKLLLLELLRLALIVASIGVGIVAVVKRFQGGSAIVFWSLVAFQQLCMLGTTLLDVHWTRIVRLAVVTPTTSRN